MDVIKPYDCLLNCLKEVRLDKFHPNFVQHGITNCDHLCNLTLDQYSKFGIMSLEDCKSLFSIIQVIKSVQAGGMRCQHGVRIQNQNLDRIGEAAFGSYDDVSRAAAILIENFKSTVPLTNADYAPKKLKIDQTKHVQANNNFIKPINLSKNYKVTFERSAEEELNQKQLIKSGFTFKKQSDSPVFHCKKTLNFSDPDLYSDEESTVDKASAKEKAQLVSIPGYSYRREEKKATLFENKSSALKTVRVTEEGGRAGSLAKETARTANIAHEAAPLHNNVRTLQEGNVLTSNLTRNDRAYFKASTRAGILPHSCDNFSSKVDKEVPDGENLATKNLNSQGPYVGKETSSCGKEEPLVNNIISVKDSEKVEPATSATAFASTLVFNSKPFSGQTLKGITKETVASSKHLKPNLQPNHFVEPGGKTANHSSQSDVQSFWNNARHLPKNILNKNHAYFPTSEAIEEVPKTVHIEQVIHSGGYNYGIPGEAGKAKTDTPEARICDKSLQGILHSDRIKVCVRKRPRNAKELKRNEKDVIRIHGPNAVVVQELKVAVDLTKFMYQHNMKFDEVFDDKCSNQEVYDRAVKPLVSSLFEKGSAICFAFGQTGAGKTHTLMGSRTVPGLYQLAAEDLFAIANSGRYREPLQLWISFYEIYCGHVYDLLNKRNRLHIRENGKQKVCVAGLMENPVNCVENLNQVISYGNSFRSRGSTGVNPHSSRSHAILEIQVRDSRDNRICRLKFIDLAGSERASDATNLDRQARIEGAEINQSLLALKECIRSIDQESGHTPYRQSKLTLILRDSFLGNAQTVMIANVAPTQGACENTLNTLRYADRVQELRKEVALRTRRAVSPNTEASSFMPHSSPLIRKQAPSLFHPSDIQFSSTPLKNGVSVGAMAAPLNLSEIVHDAADSPISGHRLFIRKNSSEAKEDVPRAVNISPNAGLHRAFRVGGSDSGLEEHKQDEDGKDDNGCVPSSAENLLHCRLLASYSEHKCDSREKGNTQNSELELALPCTCKPEEELLSRSKELEDELLQEHKKVKSHAEMVMSKVKSVIVSWPGDQFEVNGGNDPAQTVFLETKLCMENARDNIRDFLDNEKKSRMALRPSEASQPPDSLNMRKITQERDSLRVDHSTIKVNSAPTPIAEGAAHDTVPLQVHCEERKAQSVAQRSRESTNQLSRCVSSCDLCAGPAVLDSSNKSGGSAMLYRSSSDNNASNDMRSWAVILQESNGSRRTSANEMLVECWENGLIHDVNKQTSGSVVENVSSKQHDLEHTQEEQQEDIREEKSSFVASKEIRSLKQKIEELRLQRESLEREQQLYTENQHLELERFKEGFSVDHVDSRHPTTSNSLPLQKLSPTSRLSSAAAGNNSANEKTAENHVTENNTAEELESFEGKHEHICTDENRNCDGSSKQNYNENCSKGGSRSCSSDNFNCNCSSCDGGARDLGVGRRETVCLCRQNSCNDNRVLPSAVNGTLRNPFPNGVLHRNTKSDTQLGCRDVGSRCGIERNNDVVPSCDDNQVPHDGCEVHCVEQWSSCPSADLQRHKDGSRLTFLGLHENSAFSKVDPSAQKFRNSCQQLEAKPANEAHLEVSLRQKSVDVLTSDKNCIKPPPVGDVAVSGFEPIEAYPLTPRASDTSELRRDTTRNSDSCEGPSIEDDDSKALHEVTAFDRTRSLLVAAHEDQLTAVTQLCKREMLLLMAVRTGQMNFRQYMENVRDILCKKSKIILALVEHVSEFHTTTEH